MGRITLLTTRDAAPGLIWMDRMTRAVTETCTTGGDDIGDAGGIAGSPGRPGAAPESSGSTEAGPTPDPGGGELTGSTTLAHDIWRSIRLVRLWKFLAWRGLVKRHEQTRLGFLWIPASALIHMAFVGTVFSFIFPGGRYIPHFVLGYAAWSVIARGLNDSARLWQSAEKYLKHVSIPVSIFIVQLIAQSMIRMAFILPIAFVIAIIFKSHPSWATLLVIPGVVVLVANLTWILTILSVLCMRVRDVGSFLPNAVFMCYLLTPIIWQPERLGSKAWVVNFNPLYQLVELIRAPLMGHPPSAITWGVTIGMVAVGTPIAYAALAATRKRIVLWI